MQKIAAGVLLIFLVNGFCFSFPASREQPFDQYFDEYGSQTLWWQEKIHLDNFAYFLKKHPETIGYIAFHKSPNESMKKFRSRAKRVVNFLTIQIPRSRRVKKEQIVAIYDGESENPTTVLQPVDKGGNSPFAGVCLSFK